LPTTIDNAKPERNIAKVITSAWPFDDEIYAVNFYVGRSCADGRNDLGRIKMADVDIGQLSGPQQEALQQYMHVTNQEAKDAIPLLERSQWNVQVCSPSNPHYKGLG
jgi:hypothetical protein